MNTLRISGYNHRFRYNIMKGAVDRIHEMNKKFRAGVLNRYRSRQEINIMKSERSGRGANTWFIGDKGTYSSTLTVPYTPNSELANQIKTVTKDKQIAGGKTKIIEATGHPITAGLQARDPFRTEGCPYAKSCLTDPKTDCTVMNVTYRLDCEHCPKENINRSVYLGCTGKSLHNRTKEHTAKVTGDTKKEDNSMAKHMAIHHGDIQKKDRKFVSTIIARHEKTLGRFVDESVRLAKTQNLANSKGEWGCGGLVRLIPSRQDQTQEYTSPTSCVPARSLPTSGVPAISTLT